MTFILGLYFPIITYFGFRYLSGRFDEDKAYKRGFKHGFEQGAIMSKVVVERFEQIDPVTAQGWFVPFQVNVENRQ